MQQSHFQLLSGICFLHCQYYDPSSKVISKLVFKFVAHVYYFTFTYSAPMGAHTHTHT